MDICPRDSPNWVLCFPVAVFASFGLKIKCPVLALIVPFIFIFIRLKLHNLSRTNYDLKHLMCVREGEERPPAQSEEAKCLCSMRTLWLEFRDCSPRQGKPSYKTNKLVFWGISQKRRRYGLVRWDLVLFFKLQPGGKRSALCCNPLWCLAPVILTTAL